MTLLSALQSESTAANGNRYVTLFDCSVTVSTDSIVIQDYLLTGLVYPRELVTSVLICGYMSYLLYS